MTVTNRSIAQAKVDNRNSMKTLETIKYDMSVLYEQVRTGEVDLKLAAELANITGKFLKAEQLQLAREIFIETHAPERKEITVDVARQG
jgi:hypothetical protein